MELVEFETVNGYEVVPGTMCIWRRNSGPKARNPINIVRYIKQDTPLYNKGITGHPMIEDDGEEVQTYLGRGNSLTPLYMEQPIPSSGYSPRFKNDIVRVISGLEFTVGDTLLFPDRKALCELTGHTHGPITGSLAKITDDDRLVVRFRANLENQVARSYMILAQANEVEIVTRDYVIGRHYETQSVAGLQSHNVFSTEFLETHRNHALWVDP